DYYCSSYTSRSTWVF
nr:immunoglobulin light chain junction region [Macaca mulatta]MOW29742.1 immunoglobulin light chain junction region [Macaca mulatta]MOW30040.1 immunoglobulin light chain junction region [Macaca mulatta]MOW30857.1 immunoglobulin light chain junction region [Macaca mulatta]